jgi:hypothetical protein
VGGTKNVLTAIVFIPVKLVTVAEPPRISMDETMMFVARLPVVTIEEEERMHKRHTRRT